MLQLTQSEVRRYRDEQDRFRTTNSRNWRWSYSATCRNFAKFDRRDDWFEDPAKNIAMYRLINLILQPMSDLFALNFI